MDRIEEVIFYAIDHTYRKKQNAAARYFAELGLEITPEQWVLLKVLSQYDAISQKDLAEKAAKDTASITRMIDILERKEFIKREPAPDDRRKYYVKMLPKGISFVKNNLKHIIAFRKKALKGISNTDIERMKNVLETMQKNLE